MRPASDILVNVKNSAMELCKNFRWNLLSNVTNENCWYVAKNFTSNLSNLLMDFLILECLESPMARRISSRRSSKSSVWQQFLMKLFGGSVWNGRISRSFQEQSSLWVSPGGVQEFLEWVFVDICARLTTILKRFFEIFVLTGHPCPGDQSSQMGLQSRTLGMFLNQCLNPN